MIGGLLKPAGFASIAAAGLLMGGVSAQAADLGGDCCADLEERVAELEATTVRKGNRKVSLEVSGHVNESIVFWDVDTKRDRIGPFGEEEEIFLNTARDESNVYIGTNDASRSRFRFKGMAQINADWSAGFLMEFGVRSNDLKSTNQSEPLRRAGIDIRHEALYLKSRSLGTVWLGWTSSATDGITEICLGCGLGNGPDFNDDMSGLRLFAADFNGDGDVDPVTFGIVGSRSGKFPGDGDRREVIRYVSPTLAGFVVSAAAGPDDFYDVALRYAAEFNGVRIAGGVGYQYSLDGNDDPVSGTDFLADTSCSPGGFWREQFFVKDRECQTFGASLSFQHVPTGLYVAGSYGQNWDDTAPSAFDSAWGWHVTGGINQRWTSLGRTNIWGMYTYSESSMAAMLDEGLDCPPFVDGGDNALGLSNCDNVIAAGKSDLVVYGIGIEQNIDAAAMELYLWWKHMDASADGFGRIGQSDQVVTGARIKF